MTLAALQQADAALRRNDLAGAERALAAHWRDAAAMPADALLLLAAVRRRQNRLADGERLLRRAIALAPDDPRCRAALGDLLVAAGRHAPAADAYAEALRLSPGHVAVRLAYGRALLDAGRAGDAEKAARAALALSPDAAAWTLMSNVLRAQDRLEEALAAADEALKLEPVSAHARHSRAVALNRLGRNEEALALYDELVARGVAAPALWLNRGVALLALTRDREAEAAFADGVGRWPLDRGLQNALANVRWMRGAGQRFTADFEAVVAANPDHTQLRIACADLLRRADFRDRAEAMLQEGLARAPEHPSLLASLGVLLDECDRTGEGLPLLQRAVARAPNVSSHRANLACALLRLGRGDEALAEIGPARTADPLNQEWICYETMALRQIGDPRYHELCDYERMVRAFDLPAPPGYRDIAAFNEALKASLDRLHVLGAHPLDQSLRGGSQTTRSLITVEDPVIRAYIEALDAPIRAYIEAMGEPDPAHPWSGRKTGEYRLSGAWSVKLKPGGFHVNHLHPAGWISSAYYVSLPKAVTESDDRQGWIKFGEPRWPTPGCTIEKVVQPRAGRLVLFPSYMWHGTIPFSAGERMTAPFDAVPA